MLGMAWLGIHSFCLALFEMNAKESTLETRTMTLLVMPTETLDFIFKTQPGEVLQRSHFGLSHLSSLWILKATVNTRLSSPPRIFRFSFNGVGSPPCIQTG